MATLIEYAQLADRTYQDIRSERNLPPRPDGWSEYAYISANNPGILGTYISVGFSAGVYVKGSQVVISYAGTNADALSVDGILDWGTNLVNGVGLGGLSPQVFSAALLYQRIKAIYRPEDGYSISFTGHSLGGGLASLMAAAFDQPATVFAPAPFALSVATYPLIAASLALLGYVDSSLLAASVPVSGPLVAAFRASQITSYELTDEVLSLVRAVWPTLRGPTYVIDIAGTNLPILTRHSMQLHLAEMTSNSLRIASKEIPSLLTLVEDRNLYARDLRTNELDFLTRLIQFQFGAPGIAPNGLLDRFGNDVRKISDGGLVCEQAFSDALITSAIEYYYFLEGQRPEALFSQVNGGVRIDYDRVRSVLGSQSEKGFPKLRDYLANTYAGLADGPTSLLLDSKKVFYLQSGGSALVAASDVSRDVVMIGWGLDDRFNGGVGDDLIFGEGGADVLSGGAGSDQIVGGIGDDKISGEGGADRLWGNLGADQIDGGDDADFIYGGADGDDIKGGEGDDVIYGDVEDLSSLVEGNDIIEGGAGEDRIYGGAGVDTLRGGADGDVIEGNAGADVIYGNAGTDTIRGGADNDTIYGGDGAIDNSGSGNYLFGDAGEDKIYGDGNVDEIDGGTDNDLLVGNLGKDTIEGGGGKDKLYGDLQEPDSAVGDDDQLSGGAEDDELYGGAGRDILLGGEGKDLLRGGKGVGDYMLGGAGKDNYIYLADDGGDLVFDDDGLGEIKFNDITLNGGSNHNPGELTWYDGDPCDADFTYSATSDPNAGPVTLTVTSKAGGLLKVFDFDNGELGITLSDGKDPSCGKRPPTPARSGPPTRGDPLVLDLGAAGIATYGLAQNLYFDMDGDGFAEKTGWAGAEEGVLVYDRNSDGILNDGQELFGDFTRLNGGQLATGGFQALSAYDANHDGLIDAQDPVWSQLRLGVWETDPFGALILGDPKDAMSLKGLDAFGITSISIASTIVPSAPLDPSVNVQTRTGTYTLEGGATRQVAEFRLARDNAETKFLHNLPVPEANASDPSLALGGQVMNLQQALIRDDTGEYLGRPAGALRAKLDAFTNEADPTQWFARFEELLFAWTGADAIPAGLRTGPFDARHAAVLEKSYGQSFQNPNADQWAAWQTAYEQLCEAMYSGLLAETHLETQYDAIDWAQSSVTQSLIGDLSAAQAMLDSELAGDPVRGRALVNEFARSLRGLGHTQDTTYLALREHFIEGGTEPSLGFAFDATGKAAPYKPGAYTGWGTIFTGFTEAVHSTVPLSPYGLTGDDVFYVEGPAGSGSHLVGTTGANVLVATEGNDLLWAHEGEDLLDGGAGADTLKGLAGNDVYVFRRGSGRDTIQELDGVDTVFFGGGLRREDLVLRRTPDGGFELKITGTDDALVIPAPRSWVPSPHGGSLGEAEFSTSTVERFLFDDGTVLRLQDFVQPTEGDDDLAPLEDPFDDAFDMLGGDDRVDGKRGDDTLLGGAGEDMLIGGEGDDILAGGAGDDTLFATSNDPYFTGFYSWGSYLGVGAGNGSDEYRFGFGDGHDTLTDLDTIAGNVDTIALGAGVTPDDVTLFAEGDDMVVELSSGDTLTVKAQYLDAGGVSIERIAFADGTVWSGETLATVTLFGTPGDDQLAGAVWRSNHLIGAGGDDELRGALAADALEGGDGDDALYGGEGADLYDGGAGDDLLEEPASSSDRSVGGDVFVFGRGDGKDTIVSRKVYSSWRAPQPLVDDDVVRFEAGVGPEDLVIEGTTASPGATSSSSDIVVRIVGDPDSSLRIEGFLDGRASGYAYASTVRRFEFADGTAWDYDQIADRVQWIGTTGADTLKGGSASERMFGLAGDDQLNGRGGNDTIDGSAGDDILNGEAGDDLLLGGDGDDRLEPGMGNDTADGGAGDDLIGLIAAGAQFDAPQFYNLGGQATPGDLTVLFGRGDGHDTVQVANARADSNDTIRLEPGIAPGDIALARVRDDLVLEIAGTEDRVTVRNWFLARDLPGGSVDPFRIENIAFDDGTVLDADAIRARVLVGGEGRDTLRGYDDRDDLVLGNGGDDNLSGGDGNDVYAFERGDGNDTIVGYGGQDAVEFGAGVTPDEALVRNRGGNMVLALDTGESITALGQFSGFGFNLAEVRFGDGTAWDEDMLRERALAGTPDDDVIEGFDTDDEIAVAGGYDEVDGGLGDDFYVFESGFASLSDPGGFDTLSFGALAPDEVDFSLSIGELYVEILATGDAVAIQDFAGDFGPAGNIDEFLFDEGATSLSAFQVFTLTGAGDEEVIFGTDFADVLEGSDRNTIVFAGDGDDRADGEGGADELYGEVGADLLRGGLGDDVLVGNDGDDRLEGGAGRDWNEAGSGNDTIFIGLGSGLDEVIANEAGAGGEVPVREGFEAAYQRARDELSALEGLDDDETFQSSFWSSESDGGAAFGIPNDLLQPLFDLQDGVSAEAARYRLLNLADWLRSFARQNPYPGPVYSELESQAREQMAQARALDDAQTYTAGGWQLFGPHDIPDEIFDPLFALSEGVPAREAEQMLATFLGWLYGARESEAGFAAPLYGTTLVELYNVDPTQVFYYDALWAEADLFDAPEELAQAVHSLAQGDGVPVGPALEALRRLEDWLLQREAGGAGEEDTIEFGEDIAPEDLDIATYVDEDTGEVTQLAIGIRGTNDGVIVSQNGHDEGNTTPVADLSVRTLRFSDGRELSLEEVLDMADGTIGFQRGSEDADTLKGSAAEDFIRADEGDDILLGRGNDDILHGQAGSDILGAGAGEDSVDGSEGDDLIAGEKGDDDLEGGEGDDTYVFNYGDGKDTIEAEGGADTLSFGVDITPEMVRASVDAQGTLTLAIDDGEGGSVSTTSLLQRLQFVDANGAIRIFDLAGFVADAAAAELTGSEVPAGGGHAVAYAQGGDLFAVPFYAGNEPSGEGDQLIGGDGNDKIDAGAGDDVVAGGAGNDYLFGGEGDDILSGGPGADFLEGGGGGNDIARGGEGFDTYYFTRGDGEFAIEDSGANALEFYGGIEFGELALSHRGGFLEIRFSSEGDLVRLAGFDAGDPFGGSGVSTFYFDADGETYDLETILERGFTIEGTGQADSLEGTATRDTITAGDGADFITGGAGDDTLAGGDGSDSYVFGPFDGADTLLDRESDVDRNVLQFDSGIDPLSVYAELIAGDLVLYYGEYGDSIRMPEVRPGDAERSALFDRMEFAGGSTLTLADLFGGGLQIFGTSAGDELAGAQGNDDLYGFEGADRLAGGAGDDFYYFAEGGGLDTVVDSTEGGQLNTVVFDHAGAQSIDDLAASFDRGAGTLVVRVRGTEDGVALTGFDADDPSAHPAADLFVLQNGGEVAYDELVARGFELEGTAAADVLVGSAVHDVIRGREGNDVIAGGAGSDLAEGGAGNDLYVFKRGDGVLTIRDEISRDAENILSFGPGIVLADLRNNLRFEAPDAAAGSPGVLRIGLGGGDEVRIEGFDPEEPETAAHAVETYRFDDGTSIGYRELVLNTFIVQGDTGDDLLAGTRIQDRLYGFEGDDELHAGDGNDTLTGGTGDDLLAGGDGGDMYVFHRGDGNDILADSGDNYDANFLAFDADIDPAAIGFTQDGDDMVVAYTGADSVRIQNWNPERPSIREIRVGDLVTTVAALQNLQPYAGSALEDQTALEDSPFSYQLPADAFADPEGSGLGYYADLADGGDAGNALPAWLAFDPAARTLYGTPENADVGGIDVRITATDPFGATASQTLRLDVANVNDAPVLAAPLADASATEDEPFSATLPAGIFADVDAGDALGLGLALASGEPLPAWLGFDAATRTLSGTPANGDVGELELRLTATDLAGAGASGLFALTVQNVNDAPLAQTPIGDQAAVEDAPFSLTVPAGAFAEVDAGDALFTYASRANGEPLPAWLTYDPDTQSFGGTPRNEDVGAFSVTLTAVDAAGAAASQTFAIAVANGNDAPEARFAELEAMLTEDNGLPADAVLAAQGGIQFTDVDLGDVHEVQFGPLEPGYLGAFSAQLTADSTGASAADPGAAGSAQWSFSVDNGALDAFGEGEAREQQYEVLVDDGQGGVLSSVVTVALAGVNDAPTLANPVADQSATAGAPFSFTLASNTFTDVDGGDALSYAASQEDGSPLPSWLGFDAATRTFAGTAPASTTAQSLSIRVSASDSANASAADSFVLAIAASPAGGDCVPIVGTDHGDVIDGTSGNDVIDGREGYDRMSGGAGDDVYYVDRTGNKVDLVSEDAAAGYDTVYSQADYTLGANVEELHLIGRRDLEGHGNALANVLIGNTGDNELYGEAGNDLLLDDAGEDRLDGGAGDDVLDGGAGDDVLLGGAGNDLYVHAARGGDDVVQDSGGTDAIRFGEGIAQASVSARRSGNDLQLRVAGGNGSVTVKDWFSSSARRVESVQFADGTSWDEAAIRARLTGTGPGGHGEGYGGDGGGSANPCGNGNRGGGRHDSWDDDRGDRRGDHGRRDDGMFDAIAARLQRKPNYDFTALAQYLQRNGGGYGAMTPAQIASRWLQVQNCVASLATGEHDGDGGGHGGGHHGGGWSGDEGHPHRGWGYHGSTGQGRGCGGMDTFAGLGEGFRKL